VTISIGRGQPRNIVGAELGISVEYSFVRSGQIDSRALGVEWI
jgi:hypothetical protein